MATMNISLPEQMKAWAEAQAETGRYSNTSDYVRDLIRRDQERWEKTAELQSIVDRSLASGISTKSISEIWDEAKKRFEQSAAQ
ncbi:type II toxin-antitoxin system ParD family antitoxin [Asticcacaulis sp. BYS171W]|uniref:Type II toxin-antitoxin system ParD family antitoxin n=1 Tax=Asticcacaulis aquaticus TaxID=2984212 RepID=A0ABT5HQ88_9CAUL|nr:type II toxin-antitoxin system ParD family antitoxin [Asticcacaulis aquaticus]MDC7682226.1 type II toxin-antitoxin system ParD family antitoxin [Asticcacaulis aquaticus]